MGGGNPYAKKARYWQQKLGEAARSGISIREFCRRRGLKESQFYWWQHRLRMARPEGATAKPGGREGAASFALVSEDAAGDAGIELVLNGGRCADPYGNGIGGDIYQSRSVLHDPTINRAPELLRLMDL